MKKYNLLIDGELKFSKTQKYFESINPSTGEVFAQVADGSLEDMRAAIMAARKAFDAGVTEGVSAKERGEWLIKIADLIREHAKELADLECRDTGKTSKQTTFIDIPTVADTFEYFGKAFDQLKGRINPVEAPVKSLTEREPLGVVGCIIPWNYPLIMFGWKVAPAILAGNTVVFRPSSNASVSILRLAELIIEKEILPAGVLNIVAGMDHEVSSELVKSDLVSKISFTGGTETGKELMRLAAGNVKRLTLELGGKSPNIVFADCDFDAAIGGTLSAIFMNQGQMCTAGSRLLLEESIYERFVETLVGKAKTLKIGNASDFTTDFGPLVSKSQVENIKRYVFKGLKEGATLACGGKVPENVPADGYYFEPTIFTGVTNEMTIAQEEIFGPVLCVIKFKTEEEAVKTANDTKYGLAACIWTKDTNKAQRVAKELKCGTVWINTYGGFYNEAPIGGYKQSGFGRELGLEGLLEFTQTKNICLDETPGGKALVTQWF